MNPSPLKQFYGFFGVLKPFLNPKKNPTAIKHWVLILITLALNALLIYSSLYATLGFNSAISSLILQNTTYQSFLTLLQQALSWVMVWCVASSMMVIFKNIIANDLHFFISHTLLQEWFHKKNFYHLQFIPNEHNPAQLLTVEARELAMQGIGLFFSFFETLISLFVSTYHLSLLSGVLQFEFQNKLYQIPGYIVLASLSYAYIKSTIVKTIHQGMNQALHAANVLFNLIYQRLLILSQMAESVLFQQGEHFEYQWIKNHYEQFTLAIKKQQIKLILHNVFEIFNQNISQIFGFVLIAPKILSKELTLQNGFDINYHLLKTLSFFSWFEDNKATLHNIHSIDNKLSTFRTDLKKVEKIVEINNKGNIIYQNEQISPLVINNLSFHKPNGIPLIDNLNAKIVHDKVILLTGTSGVGKSTLLKALAGLWPFIKHGECLYNMKKEEIAFIPQNLYIPPNETLLNILFYPKVLSKNDANYESQFEKAHHLLAQLNLEHFQASLEESKPHWGNILSGGEKQRLAILNTLLKEPKMVFLDEATSALDNANKRNVLSLLIDILPNSTLVIIDHNPLNEYVDVNIHIKNREAIDNGLQQNVAKRLLR